MTIRPSQHADLEAIAELYSICFPQARRSYEAWISTLQPSPRRGVQDLFIAEERGEVCGALVLFPHRVHLGAQKVLSGGIGGVAVRPDCRNRGIARSLMLHAAKLMAEKEIPLSMLYPFKHSFYEKLGYGTIGETAVFTLRPDQFPSFEEATLVEPFQDHDGEALSSCYDRFARSRSFVIERSAAVWHFELERAASDRGRWYCFHEGNRITGYLLLMPGTPVEVRELVHTTDAALRGLLGFLHALEGSVEHIVVSQPLSEKRHYLFRDPLDPQAAPLFGLFPRSGEIGIGYMLRVIDAFLALGQRPFSPSCGFVTFEIADDQLVANRSPVTLELNETASVSRRTTTHRLAVTSSVFAQLYAGVLSFTRARAYGLLKAEFDLRFLDEAFALPPPECLDFF